MGFAALTRRIHRMEVKIPPDPLVSEIIQEDGQMAGCGGKSPRYLRAVEPVVGESSVIQRIGSAGRYILGHQQAHRLGPV